MRKSLLNSWIDNRRYHKMDDRPLIRINPADNVLLGMTEIMNYLRVRSENTVYQLIDIFGLPAIKRPDGIWMSTMTSIDQWIFIACEIDASNRTKIRGHNDRAERYYRKLRQKIANATGNGAPTEPTEEAQKREP